MRISDWSSDVCSSDLAPADESICFDERLREKKFGILDGLTFTGIDNIFPDQARFRQLLGKFYHRPPGGESWCDVILRLRSVLDTISRHYAGRRVMIFTHTVELGRASCRERVWQYV